jgi:hypothetical protein
MFQKPDYFLMDAPSKRIIICGPDEQEALWAKFKLGLWHTARLYCGTTQYNLGQLDGWTQHTASYLIEELEKLNA